jgi:hypothetical protein
VCVNPTQVLVTPTQVFSNPTQVLVTPTQVCVNPMQVSGRRPLPSAPRRPPRAGEILPLSVFPYLKKRLKKFRGVRGAEG